MIASEKPLKTLSFITFDIETTGLMPVVNKIVEIGAVKLRAGEVVDTFQELIDPQMPKSPGWPWRDDKS